MNIDGTEDKYVGVAIMLGGPRHGERWAILKENGTWPPRFDVMKAPERLIREGLIDLGQAAQKVTYQHIRAGVYYCDER